MVDSVAAARERFLEAGDAPRLPVRTGVVESWRRSRLSGVPYDDRDFDPPYFGDLDGDSRLVRAAKPVLDRLAETLTGTPMSLLLTDERGRVLIRRSEDGSLLRKLDRVRLAPNFGYAEDHVGTNGIGTALAARRVFYVCGDEHFAGPLHRMGCAGAPIFDRLSGRMVGAFDLTCRSDDADPLMPALAASAASDIEQRLLDLGAERERAMLAEFLAARGHGRAVLTIGEDLIMESGEAAGLLGPTDYTIIRDNVAALPGRELVSRVLLSRGQPAMLRLRPVGTHGAVVEITMAEPSRPSRPPVRPRELNLAGGSALLTRACTELRAHCLARTWTLVEGEPGVGKRALAEAVHRRFGSGGSFAVIEPGHADRLTGLGPADCAVLRHPERFDRATLAAVLEWMAAEPPDRPWLVATTSAPGELSQELLARLPVTLTVPPLRHRIDDVREIAPALLCRFAHGRSVTCGAAAMRLLLRSAWPGNVAELANALRHALTRRRSGQIQPADLPAWCHTTSRRVLTPLETMERDAIIRALLETGGDKAAAAQVLGISRATIYRRISAYGIVVETVST